MSDGEPYELEMTPDRVDYVNRIARMEAGNYCSEFVSEDDVVQEVLLNLLRKPPKYNPQKGASEKTFLHTAVKYIVMKYSEREARQAKRNRQLKKRQPDPSESEHDKPITPVDRQKREFVELRPRDLTWKGLTADDVLRYIDDPASKHLCITVIDCEGNMSAAARRLGVVEGTVRHRLKMLGPKLIAAGFNPFREEWV